MYARNAGRSLYDTAICSKCGLFLYRSLDAVIPLVFVLLSLVVNIRRRIRTWRSRRQCRLDPHSLRLPTSKDAAILRRSLVLLVLILLEISCWAFLFAWRLESAILEHGASFDAACGTPLYQVVDPGLALIPRVRQKYKENKAELAPVLTLYHGIDLHAHTSH